MTRIVLCIAALIVIPAAARADLPLPFHLKYVDPIVRFEGIESYPEFVFFVRFYSTGGNPAGCPPRLVELTNSEAFHLGAQRRMYHMAVLAMPRAEFNRRKAEDSTLAWLAGKPMESENMSPWLKGITDVQIVEVEHPPLIVSTFEGAGVTAYQVSIEEGHLSVNLSPPTLVDFLQRRFVLLVFAVALAASGIWLVRRFRRSTST